MERINADWLKQTKEMILKLFDTKKECKLFRKNESKLCPFTNVHPVQNEELTQSKLSSNLKASHFQLTFKKHDNIYITA